MLGEGDDLALEETAKRPIGARRQIHRRDVGELVVGDHVETLGGDEGLEREVGRRHVEQQLVAGNRRRGGVAPVGEVLEQHRQLLGRIEAVDPLLEIDRVLDAASCVGGDVAQRGAEIHQPDVVGLQDVELRGRRGDGRQDQKNGQRAAAKSRGDS